MEYKGRIKYDNLEWLVIDAFTYNEEKYMYLIEDVKEEIESKEDLANRKDIKMIFIKKLSNGNYTEVKDEESINKLSEVVAINFLRKTK